VRIVFMECLLLGLISLLSPVSKLLTWWHPTDRSRRHLQPLSGLPTDPDVSGDLPLTDDSVCVSEESHQPLLRVCLVFRGFRYPNSRQLR